jgi:hypothetical protein
MEVRYTGMVNSLSNSLSKYRMTLKRASQYQYLQCENFAVERHQSNTLQFVLWMLLHAPSSRALSLWLSGSRASPGTAARRGRARGPPPRSRPQSPCWRTPPAPCTPPASAGPTMRLAAPPRPPPGPARRRQQPLESSARLTSTLSAHAVGTPATTFAAALCETPTRQAACMSCGCPANTCTFGSQASACAAGAAALPCASPPPLRRANPAASSGVLPAVSATPTARCSVRPSSGAASAAPASPAATHKQPVTLAGTLAGERSDGHLACPVRADALSARTNKSISSMSAGVLPAVNPGAGVAWHTSHEGVQSKGQPQAGRLRGAACCGRCCLPPHGQAVCDKGQECQQRGEGLHVTQKPSAHQGREPPCTTWTGAMKSASRKAQLQISQACNAGGTVACGATPAAQRLATARGRAGCGSPPPAAAPACTLAARHHHRQPGRLQHTVPF